MRLYFGLVFGGVAAALVAGQVSGGTPLHSALGLAGLALAGLTTRLGRARRVAAVPLAALGAALIASTLAGGWELAGALAAVSGALMGGAAGALWRGPGMTSRADATPRNADLWAALSEGRDPTAGCDGDPPA
ncbi:MAG: hypothetical protein Q3997_02400 [Propionibacteriaceae bacterium]|nr:hypothetical protein [Propionibacteriaceae bacterium]